MKNLAQQTLIILVLIFFNSQIFSQENYAVNIKTDLSGSDKMLITYDIEAKDGARYFNVIILITNNGQKVQPNSAYGDYGSKITAGKEKAIVWYYKNDFEGDINNTEVDVFAYRENEPQAEFLPRTISNNGFAPCEVSFSNSSTDANDYKWDFGDPNSGIRNHSFEKEPVHVYEKGGHYNISLVATNTDLGLESTFYYTLKVLEHPPTIADFDYSTTDLMPPYDIVFRDKSTNANTLAWDFGDPESGSRKNTSSASQTKHKYKSAGSYSVKLTASNSITGLSNTVVKEIVLEEPELPDAKFVFSLTAQNAPSIAVFKNTSTNANDFRWDFGDPRSGSKNESTEENPNHTYNIPGEYEVKLTASDKQTGIESVYSLKIQIAEPPKPPEARFRIENNNVIAPSTVIFTNISNNADLYSWDFGDPGSGNNNKSTKKDPTHTYTKAGKYTVSLKSSSSDLGASDEFTDIVIVSEPSKPPVASFSYESGDLIAPVFVNFKNESSNADSYIWDFGDPGSGSDNSSRLVDPTHTFSRPGTYKVTLNSTNTVSGEIAVHSIDIVVQKPISHPEASFKIEDGELFAPAMVRVINNSINSESYTWDFGDPESAGSNSSTEESPVHTYLKSGTYKITLTCGNQESDRTSTHTEIVTIKEAVKLPVAGFSFDMGNAVAPANVKFANTSSNSDNFSWDFGDPSSGSDNSSSEKNPTHTYLNPGNYKVILICGNSQTNEVSTHFENLVVKEPVIIPVAEFSIEGDGNIAPALVKFSNLSENADNYTWDFGDPASDSNTSTQSDPQHVYQRAGQYKVTLTAKRESSGEISKITKNISIARPIPPPEADFTYILNGDIAPVEVSFSNNSINGDSYVWDFGDPESGDNESKEANPSHTYANPGKYSISLSTTNSATGKTDMITKIVTIVSEFTTFIHFERDDVINKIASSVIINADGEFMVLISNEKEGTDLITINDEGEIVSSREYADQLFDIEYSYDGESYVLAGCIEDGTLAIHSMTHDLDLNEPVLLEGGATIDYSYSTPKVAVSGKNDVGLVGNIIESGKAVDFWFQKVDSDGIPVPVNGKTFKFIGIKLENELIPSEDDGYAITGYWQEDESKPKRLMFASVDSTGKGYLKAITAVTNFIGCDIVSSHSGGYGILAAQGDPLNETLYNIVFMVVDLDGGPKSFSGLIHGDLYLNELQKFPPCLVETEGGYVIASHSYNGTDYDINIFWIDVTGEMIMKKETIILPGDQFATDVLELDDGGYLIIGAEKAGGKYDALIMRTDPFGRVNADTGSN